MKLFKTAIFVVISSALLLSPAYAQRSGGHGGGGGHSGGGVGVGHGGFSGGFRGGYYGGRGYYGGQSYFSFGFGGWGYPYYPYYGYGYAYSPYNYGYDPYYYEPPVTIQQNYDYPYPPPQVQSQPQPAVRNNQAQNYYLIAFKDHSIQAATAYKVDGDQFHWITRQGDEKKAPLSSVDIPFSRQINHERNVELPIP